MSGHPNAAATAHLKARRVLVVALVTEAIAAGAFATGWYQSHSSLALERGRASTHLAAVEQQLSEKSGDLEHCNAWMSARLLLADELDAPAASASARVLLTAPVASVATASAAPEESASAAALAQAPDSKGAETSHFQRSRRVREVHGQSFLESPEGAAKTSP
jgi:hypothetical protein